MISLLLILVPLIAGISLFFIKNDNSSKQLALLSSTATLILLLAGIFTCKATCMQYDAAWLSTFNSRFTIGLDGMSIMLCLLTAIAFPLVFISTAKNNYANSNNFYALMLLTQAGLMGVFSAKDLLLFYFFWELALIPVYFLCSIWGGEKRIAVTFKFFIYTFIGSLLMLAGVLYLNFKTSSFAIADIYNAALTVKEQNLLFVLFFVAFAIKMPVFPFHTWQPDTYEQSPTAVTMILSGVMVKMGVFAVIRWLIPVFPDVSKHFSLIIIILSVIGMLYASVIAMQQDDMKRLIAYSSIAHIGLMSAAIFSQSKVGLEGVMLQMFSHGINVIGLWIAANAIEQKTGTRKLSELGGLATKDSGLAITFVIIAFANIALPLTNAFIGEFLMFNGLLSFNVYITVFALVSIILGAVYTLGMVQKIFYGSTTQTTTNFVSIDNNIKLALAIIVVLIVAFGVYPQPLQQLTNDTVIAIYGK